MEKNMERFSKRQVILFLVCWAAYVSTYVCRLNYSAIMPEMIKAFGFLEDPTTQLAIISSSFFITYGVAQLFSGYVGDKLPAHWLVFAGLSLSGVLNIAMGFAKDSIPGMATIWAFNGLSQSLIWSPLLKLGGEYFEGAKKEKFGLYMSTTVPIGTILAYLFTIAFIQLFAWNYAFMACGVVTLLASIGWILYTTIFLPKYEKTQESIEFNKALKEYKKDCKKMPSTSWKLCIGVMLICFLPILIHGALKDGVSQFGPTYLADNFNITTTFSIALTMILPVINVTGAFIAKWVNKYVKNELLTSLIFFGISLVAIVLLYFFADVNIALTIILLALVTNSMFAINVMMIYLIPLKFSKFGKTSTMSGILNAIAYIGTSISMVTVGALFDKSGTWTNVYIFWIAIATAAIVICVSLFKVWKTIDNKLLNN